MFMMTFGLSFVLLIISLSLKTVVLSMRVMLKSLELAAKATVKVGTKVTEEVPGGSSLVETMRKTRATAGRAVKTVQNTGKAAVNTAKTTGKVAKFTAKTGMKLGKLTIKALKLAIRALQAIINVIHSVVVFLLSLGVVGIIILVVILLFLVAAIAGALLSVGTMPGGGFGFVGSTGGVPLLHGGLSGGVSIVQPGTLPGTNTGVLQPAVDTSSLYACCKTMADWYLANVTTYSAPSTKYYTVSGIYPFGDKKVGDSCAYFASAYAALVTKKNLRMEGSSGQWYKDGTPIETNLLENGWKKYTTTEIGGVAGLKPGDIIVCNANADAYCTGGHCEVYLGPGQSFGWGQVQSKFPSNTKQLTDVSRGSNLIYISDGGRHVYGRVWRYVGG